MYHYLDKVSTLSQQEFPEDTKDYLNIDVDPDNVLPKALQKEFQMHMPNIKKFSTAEPSAVTMVPVDH